MLRKSHCSVNSLYLCTCTVIFIRSIPTRELLHISVPAFFCLAKFFYIFTAIELTNNHEMSFTTYFVILVGYGSTFNARI